METRVGEGKSAFVVNDRRGEKKEPREVEPAVGEQRQAIEEAKDKGSWKDVCYTLAMMQAKGGQVITMIRACGLRSDDRPFVADWVVPPFWPDATDMGRWQEYAKERLDTFLNCECIEGGPCSDHRRDIARWMNADGERFERTAASPVPPSLEGYLRAEMSRQSGRIVAPGR